MQISFIDLEIHLFDKNNYTTFAAKNVQDN